MSQIATVNRLNAAVGGWNHPRENAGLTGRRQGLAHAGWEPCPCVANRASKNVQEGEPEDDENGYLLAVRRNETLRGANEAAG